jgi:ABC-type antimicrobial peptide transport system, ATPase component
MNILMEMEGLEQRFESTDRRFILTIPHLHLLSGHAYVVTGPSGVGKTALLELIGLTARPFSSQTFLFHHQNGETENIHQMWQKGQERKLAMLRRSSLGFVLQTGGLFGYLNVRDNIMLSQDLAGCRDDDFATQLMNRLGIHTLADQYPSALSVGQRQRTAIARALAHCPPLLVADEPTSALDPSMSQKVLDLLLETASASGTTIVLTSHDSITSPTNNMIPIKVEPLVGEGNQWHSEVRL